MWSKKESLSVQNTIDNIISKIFLRFIPYSVKPNQITVVRFVLVPIVYWLLLSGNYYAGLIIFVIAACTDFIDGAMARTRDQITDTGKVIDPIADKLLILSVLLSVGSHYLVAKIFIVFIIFELIGVLSGAFFSFAIGRPIGANIFGKIKMILQSFGVSFFILGLLIHDKGIIEMSENILYWALFFAVIASLCQLRIKLRHLAEKQRQQQEEQ